MALNTTNALGREQDDVSDDSASEVSVDLEFEPRRDENDFEEGPLGPAVPTSQLPREPIPIPVDGLEWSAIDLADKDQMHELWQFLFLNYVADEDEEFRFDYSVECLKWALLPPNHFPLWHIALRETQTKNLIGFVGGVPLTVRNRQTVLQTCEINFLCVHAHWRKRRLAPTLLDELSRRAQLCGYIQHLYTAAAKMPRIVSVVRYYHRPMRVAKLVDVGFSSLPQSQTLEEFAASHAVPHVPVIPRLREIREADVPAVTKLWAAYSARFTLAAVFNEQEMKHHLLSGLGTGDVSANGRRTGQTVWAYVVDEPSTGRITDFMSFYSLPASVLKNAAQVTVEADPAAVEHAAGNHVLDAAYLYYYASDLGVNADGDQAKKERLEARIRALIGDALVFARKAGFDVFNATTVMDNDAFLTDRDLKFGLGTGLLNWYLDGYRTHALAGMHATEDTPVGRGIGVVMV